MKRLAHAAALLIVSLLFVPGVSYAFTFDIWTSGATIDEVLTLSERHDVPLHKSGLISGNTHFNANTSRKYADTSREFYYKTNLLDKSAKVTLYFTPASRRLSKIAIAWFNVASKSGFSEEVAAMLKDKYGRSTVPVRQGFFVFRQWSIDAGNIVVMRESSGGIELTYRDLAIEEAGSRETNDKAQQSRAKAMQKDQGKF